MRRATKAKKDESGDGKLMVEDQQSCCRKKKLQRCKARKTKQTAKFKSKKPKEAVKRREKKEKKYNL